MRKAYPSDISREQFAVIKPLLESARKKMASRKMDLYEVFCAVDVNGALLPDKFRTVHSYWAIWSDPRQGGSLLEQALKKSGWRGPRETGAQRMQHIFDHRRAEREEYGHGDPQRL